MADLEPGASKSTTSEGEESKHIFDDAVVVEAPDVDSEVRLLCALVHDLLLYRETNNGCFAYSNSCVQSSVMYRQPFRVC